MPDPESDDSELRCQARRPRAPRVPPLAVFLVIGSLMWGGRAWLPAWLVALPGRIAVSSVLLLVAGATGVAGVRAFRRACTTVDPLRPERASVLVSGGIYGRTRNPMYVALALALLAWSVWLAHLLAPVGVAAFVLWMDRLQIPAEESALRAAFGEEFERYCARVRRWL